MISILKPNNGVHNFSSAAQPTTQHDSGVHDGVAAPLDEDVELGAPESEDQRAE